MDDFRKLDASVEGSRESGQPQKARSTSPKPLTKGARFFTSRLFVPKRAFAKIASQRDFAIKAQRFIAGKTGKQILNPVGTIEGQSCQFSAVPAGLMTVLTNIPSDESLGYFQVVPSGRKAYLLKSIA